MTEKIIKTLYEIKDRPGVYIGKKNLERLALYLTGYVSCLVELTNETTDFLIKIQDYVADYYNINSDQYWVDIIRFYTLSEEAAYDKFYELFDMYMETRGRFSCLLFLLTSPVFSRRCYNLIQLR